MASRIPESMKKAQYAAQVPTKNGLEWRAEDNWRGLHWLAVDIIKYLEKQDPKPKTKNPIYYYGKKVGDLYWRTDKFYGGSYVVESKDKFTVLYKNGEINRWVYKNGGN